MSRSYAFSGTAAADDDGTGQDGIIDLGALAFAGIVEGTSGDDRIDTDYLGDPELDRVDNNDNAAGTNDDVIEAGAGNDTIIASLGNDDIDGGAGRDTYQIAHDSSSYTFIGAGSFDEAGESVSSVGDVDGDGIDDLIIGAPDQIGPGQSYLITVADLATLDALDGSIDGEIDLALVAGTGGAYQFNGGFGSDRAGFSNASAGDIDGDGRGDFIIGAPLADDGGSNSGESYLITAADLAALDALDGSTDGEIDLSLVAGVGNTYQFTGGAAGDQSGVSVSTVGDVDGDGRDDLIIGALTAEGGGARGGESYLINAANLAALDALDGSVDGEIDLGLVAGTGGAYQFTAGEAGDESGWWVSSAGDVDGDGLGDLMIGAPRADGGGNQSGEVYLITATDLASLDALDGNTDGEIDLGLVAGTGGAYQFNGGAVDDSAGRAFSSVGDIDGDGLDDFLIGVVGVDDGGWIGGASYLISAADLATLDALDGNTDGEIDLSLVAGNGGSYQFTGAGAFHNAGTSVSSAGDADGDGIADLLIGGQGSGGGTNGGTSYLITAADIAALDALDGNVDGEIDLGLVAGTGGVYQFNGGAIEDQSGSSVSSAGDIDGDGLGDFVIGAHYADGGTINAGAAYLIAAADLAALDALDGTVDGEIDLGLVGSGQVATVINVNEQGDGTALTAGATDTLTSIENFVALEGPSSDTITITDTGTGYTAADVSGLDDNAVGTFTPDGGGAVINFGPSEASQFSDILALNTPGAVQITGGDETGQVGNISFENFETINFAVACFCTGTRILTQHGEQQIETLSIGDEVFTLDGGFQPIRWIGSSALNATDLAKNPKLRPIQIRAGALGQGLPLRDLRVSPQHRVLVRSIIAERMFGVSEVLIPAIKLIGLEGVEIDDDLAQVTYWHMLFDTHAVVLSEGAPTESLFTGPEALKGVSPEARMEITALFPGITQEGYAPRPARLIPEKGRLMKQLVVRHQKNNRPMLVDVT